MVMIAIKNSTYMSEQESTVRIEHLKQQLQLNDHPEGGYFREVYRSAEEINKQSLPERFPANRNYATSIYYLLPGSAFSSFHRIKSDEIWYHHEGCSLLIPVISPDGFLSVYRLGKAFEQGDLPQVVVPSGHWFGAVPEDKESYVLAGCSVAPGFDFEDFEMGRRDLLLKEFPAHADWIERLTY